MEIAPVNKPVALGDDIIEKIWLAIQELADEQGGTAGNYGTMDAILGLEWIRDNIDAFGGDPTRVILAGQSSGGTLR